MARKDVLTYKQFADMSYQELHRNLKEMLGQAQRMSVWFNALERVNLLPARQAMHDNVAQPGRRGEPDPDKPSWEEECRSLGITPEQVRRWKRGTQADLIQVVNLVPAVRDDHAPSDTLHHCCERSLFAQ